MKISKLVGERIKTTPSDAMFKSHVLLVRAGFIKQVFNGIWTLAMPAKRIANKIENILREEMDAIGGQECLFPVVLPREMLEESGRYNSIGEELLRFKDRNERQYVLGMTHEEPAVHFARNNVTSYNNLPFMIYQIQTKFRDEARSRGGLIRVREFVMKDAYSFHHDLEDLKCYYNKVYESYVKIFERFGMKNFIIVESDPGMMGGEIAHEYMLLTPIGEDSIAICENCGYKANLDTAISVREKESPLEMLPLEKVFTEEATEIKDVVSFLGLDSEKKTMKAVVYNVKGNKTMTILCFIRGDLDVNEAKLKRHLDLEIVPANLENNDLVGGNIGPIGLAQSPDLKIVFDQSLKDKANLVIGANEPKYHYLNANIERDFVVESYVDIAKVKAGELCPHCLKPIKIENGIEIGNIFQLGDRYTKTMNMQVLDKDGKTFFPLMGCYGIGVGRSIAAIAEEYADEKGLNWPMEIAPWQVYLCPLRIDDPEINEQSIQLYNLLKEEKIEVLFDDRMVSPGHKFADCDLMGVPIRLVLSPKLLQTNQVEIQLRKNGEKTFVDFDKVVETLKGIIKNYSLTK